MRKWVRVLCWGGIALAVIAIVVAGSLYQAWRHEPDFYTEALASTPAVEEHAGEQLEKNVLELHNEVQRDGRWEAVFTDEQLNGWLAVDLPEKFPDLLPETIQAPRVAISPDAVQMAGRYQGKDTSTVVSLAVDVHLTDEANVVAFRVRRARAGLVPLPLDRLIQQVSNAAKHAEVDLRWSQFEGDPVALVRIPSQHESFAGNELHLEAIELSDGELRIAGRSGHDLAANFFSGSSLIDQLSQPEWSPARLSEAKSADQDAPRPSSESFGGRWDTADGSVSPWRWDSRNLPRR